MRILLTDFGCLDIYEQIYRMLSYVLFHTLSLSPISKKRGARCPSFCAVFQKLSCLERENSIWACDLSWTFAPLTGSVIEIQKLTKPRMPAWSNAATATICQTPRNSEFALLADTHIKQALVPSTNHQHRCQILIALFHVTECRLDASYEIVKEGRPTPEWPIPS